MRRFIDASVNEFFNPMEMARKLFQTLSISLETPICLDSFFSFSFKNFIQKAIREFETTPEKYRELFGNFYPFYKRVLLDERKEHMARELQKVKDKHGYDCVVAIIGTGHLQSVKDLLSPEEVEVIELNKRL